MKERNKFSRRGFLRLSAVAAGGAVLAACDPGQQGNKEQENRQGKSGKGSATDPPPVASQLKEAPMLREMVDAGELPPLEERLPAKPYVVPHKWITPGKYGGQMRLNTTDIQVGSTVALMYGHSLLRWLNDGLDIGPGLVESWDSNDDASEWTLHFREGLKWSDGEPWSTEDIMFWWEDMVLERRALRGLPLTRHALDKGTLMEMSAPDDETTIVMKFDAPAPLTADRLAMWVNRGATDLPGWSQSTTWSSSIPEYGQNVPKDWASEDGQFDLKRDWARNPEVPTMSGWRLKSYNEGRNSDVGAQPLLLVRGPGGQPASVHVDTINASVYAGPGGPGKLADPGRQGQTTSTEAVRLPHPLGYLGAFKRASSQAASFEVCSRGTVAPGAGSIMFLNLRPSASPRMLRKLIRDAQVPPGALSRLQPAKKSQKAIYFNTGEKTTGTLSPKAIEYQINEQGQQVYKQWRDSLRPVRPR